MITYIRHIIILMCIIISTQIQGDEGLSGFFTAETRSRVEKGAIITRAWCDGSDGYNHAIRPNLNSPIVRNMLNAESFANRLRAETVKHASLVGLEWSGKLRP